MVELETRPEQYGHALAYLFVLVSRCWGTQPSKSSIWTLNKVGESRDTCGTRARQLSIDNNVPFILDLLSSTTQEAFNSHGLTS
jgi:hypothetical protein